MSLSNQNKKELFNSKKTSFIIVGALLLIQLWFIWDVRKQMLIDYSFLYEQTSYINSEVFSVHEFTVEREAERGTSYSNDVYEYSYKFILNGIMYKGKDFNVFGHKMKGDTPFNISVEYLNSNPNINRVKDFVYIKNGFDFFKEYFMIKIIILLITIFYLANDFSDKKRKMLKQENF
jgi:hypothetical protein